MNITVAIPAYNAARTIRPTVDCVLRQTRAPEEILVINDGSTDETGAILESYGPSIRVIERENKGVASARNLASREASGELIAWIDSDDLWHSNYLETQARHFDVCPALAASFTGHINFYGYGADCDWSEPAPSDTPLEVLDPLTFLKRYHSDTGSFVSPSFMCVRKRVLASIGDEPFQINGTEDMYLCTWLALLGPVGYSSARLGAYRITQGSLSANRVTSTHSGVRVFELMAEHYKQHASGDLLRAFDSAFASQRRQYAKHLLGVGQANEARDQLRTGLSQSDRSLCMAKSLGLLLASHMPRRLQPRWPAPQRA